MYNYYNRKWYLHEHFEYGKPVCYHKYYKLHKSFKDLGKPPSIKLIISNILLIVITVVFMIMPSLILPVIFYVDESLSFTFTLSNVLYLLMSSIVIILVIYCVFYWMLEVKYMLIFRKEYGENKYE